MRLTSSDRFWTNSGRSCPLRICISSFRMTGRRSPIGSNTRTSVSNATEFLFLIRRTNSPSKGYTLFFDRSGFAHSDHYTVDRAGEGLRQPKHIGRLSARKVDEWLSYLTAHYRNLERLDAENARSIASFRERVEALPDVVWNYRQSGGTIERRGLSYTFEIDRTGYVEKIELHGSLHRLDEFLMLSDNAYPDSTAERAPVLAARSPR